MYFQGLQWLPERQLSSAAGRAADAAIWPVQILAYGLGLFAIAALRSERPYASRLIFSILAIMWNGIGYHLLFFSSINPAAKVFAVLFVLQAALFAASAVTRNGLRFQIARDLGSVAGLSFIIYALLIYPMLGIWAGHGLLAGPMFGVAPCPTTIFTIGMLVLARGWRVVWLSVIHSFGRLLDCRPLCNSAFRRILVSRLPVSFC